MKTPSETTKIFKKLNRLPLAYLTDELRNDPVALKQFCKAFGRKKNKISKNGIVNAQ